MHLSCLARNMHMHAVPLQMLPHADTAAALRTQIKQCKIKGLPTSNYISSTQNTEPPTAFFSATTTLWMPHNSSVR
jgi:hypothetical protein